MGWPDCGDMACDWRRRDPVANRRPDHAAQWCLQATGIRLRGLAGDEHHNPVAMAYSGLKRRDRAPVCGFQGASVEIDSSIRHDIAGRQLAIPTRIECGPTRIECGGRTKALLTDGRLSWQRRAIRLFRAKHWRWDGVGRRWISAQVRRYAPPKRAFFRAESARHRRGGQASRAEREYRRLHVPTCPPLSGGPRRLLPRKCQLGSRP